MEKNQNDRKINIAIADDDKFQRFILNALIRKNSRFKLLFEATDGQDFINKLKFCNTLPDVCIIDLKMPVMGGAEETAHIKKYNSTIKIIGYSTSSDLKEIGLMKLNGAEHVMPKSNVNSLLTHLAETCLVISEPRIIIAPL